MAQSQTDIAVIGAGPQALTLVTHILQKKAKLRDRIQVFDPSGTWLTQWQQQFAAQEIPELVARCPPSRPQRPRPAHLCRRALPRTASPLRSPWHGPVSRVL
jgi:cation diffusion facilitator CzcD-associated flavoprotein CzcO